MAVVAVWKCDRDGSMFEDKKSADAHDKMLELAEGIMHLIETHVKTVSTEDAEAIGLLLAKNRDNLLKACKGNPEVLMATAPQATPLEATPLEATPTEGAPPEKKHRAQTASEVKTREATSASTRGTPSMSKSSPNHSSPNHPSPNHPSTNHPSTKKAV